MSTKETPKKEPAKKVGDYSESGIHSKDEKDAAGMKKPFDRGNPTEDKIDLIQGEPKDKGKHNVEVPEEYAEPGFNEDAGVDSAGHKLKFDRGAPEVNPEALHSAKPGGQNQKTEETEVSEPNYVAKEHERQKQASKNAVAGLSEREFLENLLIKASAGGWSSPIITEIRHRLETI